MNELHGENPLARRQMANLRNGLLAIVATLVCIGLVLVYSASCVRAGKGSFDFVFMQRQLLWLGLGLAGLFIVSYMKPYYLRLLAGPLGLIIFGLLAAVLVPGIGTRVNGAARWLRFGGYNMQPSELAKIGMVILLAAFLARFKDGRLPFWRGFVPGAGLIGICCALIIKEPDFGTAALIGGVLLSVLIVGGARWWQVSLMVVMALPPAVFVAITRVDYILDRVGAWQSGVRDDKGYQIWQSQVALGSGGLTGMGLGEGVSKLYYLPEAHTDFIFAIAGQELGLCGTLFILTLFAAFVFQGIRIVRALDDRFCALCAYGITAVIGLQAAFNIAVVTASVPPKGISLPFISFGGSGLCMMLIAVGVLVSVTRYGKLRGEATVSPAQDGELMPDAESGADESADTGEEEQTDSRRYAA